MTQHPLGRQLESELGVQLVDRTNRSVTLTPAGVAFLPDARRNLQLAEGAAMTVKRVPAGISVPSWSALPPRRRTPSCPDFSHEPAISFPT